MDAEHHFHHPLSLSLTSPPSHRKLISGIWIIGNKLAFLVIRLLLKWTYFSDQAAGEHCLFWKKSVRMGESLGEKATQCVCVHIPHVWLMTVLSVRSGQQWSNESPDRLKIDERSGLCSRIGGPVQRETVCDTSANNHHFYFGACLASITICSRL